MGKIVKNSTETLPICLLATTPFVGTVCSDDDAPIADYSWNIEGNTIANVIPEHYQLQRNSMSGWIIYADTGGDTTMGSWDPYDNFESSKGTVKVSNYGNMLYVRGLQSSSSLEKGKHVQDESVQAEPAKRLRMLMGGTKERNLKLAFTFVCDSRDKHENVYPDYVKEAGAEGPTTTIGSIDVWTPYPDDPVFQREYEEFLTAFTAKYNDPGVAQFVDGFGLGKWDETHTLKYFTSDEAPRQVMLEWITDVISCLLTKVPIMINYHHYLFSDKGLSDTDTDVATGTVKRAAAKGFCLRHSVFGMKQHYKDWERDIGTTYHGIVPITMEGGQVESSHSSSTAGDGYKNFAKVRRGRYDEVKDGYVDMMDLRFGTNVNKGETHSWLDIVFHLVEEFITRDSYRLYLDRLSIPTIARSGSSISLTRRWSNPGWGYCPTNLPQYGDKHELAVALLNRNIEEPVRIYIEDKANIATWMKGTPKTYTTSIKFTDVTAGNYIWAVGPVDTTRESAIGILIPVHDEYQASKDWVKVGDIATR